MTTKTKSPKPAAWEAFVPALTPGRMAEILRQEATKGLESTSQSITLPADIAMAMAASLDVLVHLSPRVRYVKGGKDKVKGVLALQLSAAETGGGRRLWIETTPDRFLALAGMIEDLARDAKEAAGRHDIESFTFDAGEIK